MGIELVPAADVRSHALSRLALTLSFTLSIARPQSETIGAGDALCHGGALRGGQAVVPSAERERRVLERRAHLHGSMHHRSDHQGGRHPGGVLPDARREAVAVGRHAAGRGEQRAQPRRLEIG